MKLHQRCERSILLRDAAMISIAAVVLTLGSAWALALWLTS